MSAISARAQVIAAADRESYLDAEWALHDPDVQRRYAGQWVVASRRQIIAHGSDPKQVLGEAARLAPGREHRLVFSAPEDASNWIEHVAESAAEFNS